MLIDAGRDGWELVGVTTNNIAYLKRQLEAPAAPATVAAELQVLEPRRRERAGLSSLEAT